MAKLVGFRHVQGTSKKTGKTFDAYVVSYLEQDEDQGAVGYKADSQFVDRAMFEAAVSGRAPEKLMNAECVLVYNKSGFLSQFLIP